MDEFRALYYAKLVEMSKGKGVPSDEQTTYGTVADKLQYDRILSMIEQGKREATVGFGNTTGNGKVSF